jgi:hypothetical protein
MGNRGTTSTKPSKKTPISGEEFKKKAEKKLKDSGVEYITSGRGTGKIKVEKIKTKKKPTYKGKIHSGRGTSSQ